MLIIKVLAPKKQDDDRDFGDCFIINDNGHVVIYDCGSEELADQVLDYLKENGIKTIDVVLSHNDEDHFGGVQKLVEFGVVNSITTLLLLKYKKEIYDRITDGRVTIDSLSSNIEKMYDNIKSLSGNNLLNALDYDSITSNVRVVGPSTDYFLDAVAKQFTPSEGNTIDHSTIMNSISVQLEVCFDDKKLLLTGDADLAAFDDKLFKYDGVQLPHHGNKEMADLIFDKNNKRNDILYIVSDNKGKNINGGSADLIAKGHRVMNTKDGSFEINRSSFDVVWKGNLGYNEICYTNGQNKS